MTTKTDPMDAPTLQRLKDFGAAVSAHTRGNLLERQTSAVETNSGLQVEPQGACPVMQRMFFRADDFKVFDPIVVGITVPVMDMFVATELSADVALHDQAMFVDLRSVFPGNDSVPLHARLPRGVAGAAFLRTVEHRAAESFRQVVECRSVFLEGCATVRADEIDGRHLGGRHVG